MGKTRASQALASRIDQGYARGAVAPTPVSAASRPWGRAVRVLDGEDIVLLMQCPRCGSGEHVEIAQNPAAPSPRWAATCGGCGHTWTWDD